jgi:hypothetical protein
MGELNKIRNLLNQNKDKGFVKRILEPDKFPRLDVGNGHYATHKMAWGKVGDRFMVFPTVLYDGKELQSFTPDVAIKHVLETGNYIEFDTPQEADWFSKSYKKVWEK